MHQKIIYILIRMNNNLNYNNGGGAALLLMCLSSSLSSSSSASLFASSIESTIKATSYIKQKNTIAYDKAKGAGLDAAEIRAGLEQAYKAECNVAPMGGTCPPDMRIGANGCCEFLDPEKMTKNQKYLALAKTIAEEIIISFMFERVVSFLVKRSLEGVAARKAYRTAFAAASKVASKATAKTSARAAAKLALSTAKS